MATTGPKAPAYRTMKPLGLLVAGMASAVLLFGSGVAGVQAEGADLELTALPAKASMVNLSVVTTRWTFTNLGPSAATDAVVVVTLPPGTTLTAASIATRPVCTFDAPARHVSCPLVGATGSGGGTEVVVTFTNVANPAGTELTVEATVIANTPDPTATNNLASVTVTVPGGPVPVAPDGRSADVALRAVPPAGLVVQPTGTLWWDLLNAGPAPAEGLEVVFTLPAGISYDNASISAATGPCPIDATTRQVTCTLAAPFEPGVLGSASIQFSLSGMVPGTLVEVEARAVTDTLDLNQANNVSVNAVVVAGTIPPTGATIGRLAGLALALAGIGAALTAASRVRA